MSVATNKRTSRPRHTHPALMHHAEQRAQRVQNRIADTITRYAGSMGFVYAHIAIFATWMLLVERSPWPTLTLVVSLEAIFLSTFVMISQNRADDKRNVMAHAEWQAVQLEEAQNEELLRLSKQILELTGAIHRLTVQQAGGRVGQAEEQGPSSPHVAAPERPNDA